MIKYHKKMQQSSDEWLKARLGIVTASNMHILVTPTGKVANNEKMRAYAYEIASQRETKRLEDHFESYDMIRGHIQEDIARQIYHDNYEEVEECGFITNDNMGFTIGASPDGLVGEDGGIEIKSRLAKFQVKTIVLGEVPKEYLPQIQATMFVSGREWWDFVQYSNGLPLYVSRVFPDIALHAIYATALVAFEVEVQWVQAQYKKNSSSLVKTEWVELNADDEITGSGETK